MPELKAELRVVNDVFWVRLCTMSDLGFAEAYMYGDVECDDLVSVFMMFIYNRENLASMTSRASYLFSIPQKLTSYRFVNTIGNSRSNISAHYDISNEMFMGMFSDMTYSCAIFDDLDAVGDVQPDPLHVAQLRKLNHIIRKAHILPGQNILEIGSGWGSMAILIARTIPGTTVHTLTLSVHQRELLLTRLKEAGVEDGRVQVHLMDYREVKKRADWRGAFDRVISIEMVEAVGGEYLEDYWGVIDWAMKPRTGAGVIQGITLPESIFPGGLLPTVSLLVESMRKGSNGRLIVDSVSNIGPHYARTLREWRRRFLERFDDVIVPALVKEYPAVMGGQRGRSEIEVFKRKWICDCYCEVGFTTRTLGGEC
ncbi:cyclopropane-fatty-acyl-phospholipid synthase [Gloeophyllum trabeum ATCC 11539]|uniref:Cyclopropane-fatty-acyl-phospholipid synthase n=1 Tax=Gloeophyllum trabeum (strain ATCC 11539 / FP-39264 / Madison 617) TaxID=670483 RepID=S7Q4Z4_GLOTA|nr:cyclopropane-fatty-acyl-phospholipid synthase [Gloeophyllum trabeum ATCC 11539]EPQ54577.1 cyclopropane-fatty-acyl-phospholipid synthase [Gloeophyllum trabeum ATCC 11539]